MRSIKIDLKWAQTLDGQLCDDTGSSKWISGTEERKLTHSMRATYDAIAVGVATYINDNAQLTVREGFENKMITQPSRIIIDPRGLIAKIYKKNHLLKNADEMINDLQNGPRETYIIGKTKGIKVSNHSKLKIIEADLDFHKPNFKINFLHSISTIPSLRNNNHLKILVEGGPRLLKQLISHHLYHELFVSIAPRLTGGKEHRIELMKNLSNATPLKLIQRSFVGEDTLMVMKRDETSTL